MSGQLDLYGGQPEFTQRILDMIHISDRTGENIVSHFKSNRPR
ncbi:hypothetical protein HNR44_002342 [Geomicrobium halophilum]|uniref:Uncharacterized protein n=1 Tax=Geomicrobium halophilum TaxID=549000 RepID=A0A841PNM7_9BACL|nr:hypothetical protein [Geomicrobium halophilum]